MKPDLIITAVVYVLLFALSNAEIRHIMKNARKFSAEAAEGADLLLQQHSENPQSSGAADNKSSLSKLIGLTKFCSAFGTVCLIMFVVQLLGKLSVAAEITVAAIAVVILVIIHFIASAYIKRSAEEADSMQDTGSMVVRLRFDELLSSVSRSRSYDALISDALSKSGTGAVISNKTPADANGIYIDVFKGTVHELAAALDGTGVVPKNSRIETVAEAGKDRELGFEKAEVGNAEGLALCFEGDAAKAVIEQNKLDALSKQLEAVLGGAGRLFGTGEKQDAVLLCFYGKSYDEMNKRLSEYIDKKSACSDYRTERIA